MSRQGRFSRAFTLLELLLAMTVMSMLALSMYQSLRVCTRARRTAVAAVEPVRAATIAMELICHDFESVMPPTGILAGPFVGLHQTGTTGDADYVEFYSIGEDGRQPRQLMDEGIRFVELTLRTDVTPQVLVRRVTRNILARVQTDPEEELLCRNVRSLTIQYFDGMNWLDEWDSTQLGDVLPFAVQIQIELDNGSGMDASETPNRIMRIIPLACAKLADTSGTGGSSSGTGTGATGGANRSTGGASNRSTAGGRS